MQKLNWYEIADHTDQSCGGLRLRCWEWVQWSGLKEPLWGNTVAFYNLSAEQMLNAKNTFSPFFGKNENPSWISFKKEIWWKLDTKVGLS